MKAFFNPLTFLQALLSVSFLIMAGVAFDGCRNASQNNNASSTNASATSVSPTIISILEKNMHKVKLPFYDTCFDTVAVQRRLQLPDSLSGFKKLGQLIGMIGESKQYAAVLYSIPADVQLPVLHTFNANGEKISSLKLFIGNCCGENEACSGLSTVLITPDLHIILKDSMQTFERNKKKFDKKKNIQVFKKYEEYKIDSTGNIIHITPST